MHENLVIKHSSLGPIKSIHPLNRFQPAVSSPLFCFPTTRNSIIVRQNDQFHNYWQKTELINSFKCFKKTRAPSARWRHSSRAGSGNVNKNHGEHSNPLRSSLKKQFFRRTQKVSKGIYSNCQSLSWFAKENIFFPFLMIFLVIDLILFFFFSFPSDFF